MIKFLKRRGIINALNSEENKRLTASKEKLKNYIQALIEDDFAYKTELDNKLSSECKKCSSDNIVDRIIDKRVFNQCMDCGDQWIKIFSSPMDRIVDTKIDERDVYLFFRNYIFKPLEKGVTDLKELNKIFPHLHSICYVETIHHYMNKHALSFSTKEFETFKWLRGYFDSVVDRGPEDLDIIVGENDIVTILNNNFSEVKDFEGRIVENNINIGDVGLITGIYRDDDKCIYDDKVRYECEFQYKDRIVYPIRHHQIVSGRIPKGIIAKQEHDYKI